MSRFRDGPVGAAGPAGPTALLEAAVGARDGAPVSRGVHLRVDPVAAGRRPRDGDATADGRRLVDAVVRRVAGEGGAVVPVWHGTGASTATADREVPVRDRRAWPVGADAGSTGAGSSGAGSTI